MILQKIRKSNKPIRKKHKEKKSERTITSKKTNKHHIRHTNIHTHTYIPP